MKQTAKQSRTRPADKRQKRLEKTQKKQKKAQKLHALRTPFIELYQKEECPFSHSVRTKLTELGLDYVAHSVPEGNSLKHEQLVRAGGKDQVPFLIDHRSGTRLYESLDILKYLDSEYGPPQTKNRLVRMARNVNRQVRGRADQIAWALRTPADRLQRIRANLNEAWQTVQGSARIIRSTIQEQARREDKPAAAQEMKKAA